LYSQGKLTVSLPEVDRLKQVLVLALMVLGLGGAAGAQANLHTAPLNLDPTVRQGFEHFYQLDFDGAYKVFSGVAQQHPNDPMAWNYVLFTVIFRELYHQDLLDTTYYARNNFLTTKREIDVAPATRQQIEDLTNRVVGMCDAQLKKDPRDKNALFERGYAKGMHAAFVVLADHAFATGAKQGLAARNDSEAVLKIDPAYADADMAVGIQQFAVASLPGWVRLVVGMFGVGGNKERGLAMLRISAEHGVVTRVESRTALSLFLRHDGRYAESLVVQRGLAQEFPHDYLFRLEVANLTKDEGHGLEAIAAYRQVIDDAQRPGYFTDARLQLAWFGMADTERGYNMIHDAAYGYTQAAQQPNCSDWLRKRAWLSAGQMEDLQHNRQAAIQDYQRALAPGGDQSQASAAREYLKTPYVGK
jgi:tetratricopeptide (TPR) repeat protein